MKKWMALLSMLFLVLSPAYAMDLLENDTLADLDGQAGVTLTAIGGDITISQSMNALSWGDDNGELVNGSGAGHLGIWALTAAGATSTMGADIDLTGLTLDVDVDGIFLGLTGLNVTVTTPARMRFTVATGVTGSAYVYATATTLGDLWMQNATVGVTVPGVLQIAPH